MTEYREKVFPMLKKKIVDAAGFEVPVTVDWDKLSTEGESEHYLEDNYLTLIFFTPLTSALKQITQDEMGKKALKDKLKEIRITYDEATATLSDFKAAYTFKDGILTINNKPFSNAGDESTDLFKDRVKAIQSNVEEKL